MTTSARPRTDRPNHGARRWLAVPGVLVGIAAGVWFFGGVVAPGYTTSIVLSGAWFVVAGAIVLALARRWPSAKRALVGTFAAAAVVSAAGFYWTSIRDDKVDEAVVTGVAASTAGAGPAPGTSTRAPVKTNVEIARGSFVPKAHSGTGTAAVVDLADGGRRLTLTDFETDNGPDLRVQLHNASGDAVDLGKLKGNIGNQQYDVPADTDVASYDRVVIWCRAFSVSFAEASLRAS